MCARVLFDFSNVVICILYIFYNSIRRSPIVRRTSRKKKIQDNPVSWRAGGGQFYCLIATTLIIIARILIYFFFVTNRLYLFLISFRCEEFCGRIGRRTRSLCIYIYTRQEQEHVYLLTIYSNFCVYNIYGQRHGVIVIFFTYENQDCECNAVKKILKNALKSKNVVQMQ